MGKTVFLGLGTNLGNREGNLTATIDQICGSIGEVISCSNIYETEPWGFRSRNKFLNMAIALNTGLGPDQLLSEIAEIESRIGRKRKGTKDASRTIDIDILLYGDLIIKKPGLEVPHPLIRERRFVLVPLCDIAPEKVHPVFKMTLAELLEECRDDKKVERFR